MNEETKNIGFLNGRYQYRNIGKTLLGENPKQVGIPKTEFPALLQMLTHLCHPKQGDGVHSEPVHGDGQHNQDVPPKLHVWGEAGAVFFGGGGVGLTRKRSQSWERR